MINVVTWNMQGGGGTDTVKNAIVQQFFNRRFDAICLQEMTNPLESFSLREMEPNGVVIAYPPPPTRTPHALNNYFCYYKRWGVNPRCSLAIYTRAYTHDCGAISLPADLGGAGQRPMLWVRVAPHYYVASIHLSQDAPGTMWHRFEYFKNELAFLMVAGSSCIIAGDYNPPPDYIEAHHAAELPHFTFTPAHVPTQQNGLRLDYVYSDTPMVTNLQYSLAFPSDHRILNFRVH